MNNLSLPKEALTAYLYDVGALETAKDQIEQEEENSLTVLNEAAAELKNLEEPSAPRHYNISTAVGEKLPIVLKIVFGCAFAMFCIFATVTAFVYQDKPSEQNLSIRVINSMILGAGIGAAIGLVIGSVKIHSAVKNAREENWRRENWYLRSKEKYREEKRDLEKVVSDLRTSRAAAMEKGEILKLQIEGELKREYALGILHPQYQNREAVLVMYGMFTNGRCDTLKEALNAYEDYLWKKNDEKFMQAVTKELDDICETQEEVVRQVEAMREQTDALAEMTESKFEDLQATAEEIAARNEVIEGHARTAAFLETIQFLESR